MNNSRATFLMWITSISFCSLDECQAFAPAKIMSTTSALTVKSDLNRSLDSNQDDYDFESFFTKNPIVSPRTARLSIPLSTIFTQILTLNPNPTLAKGPSSSAFDASLKTYFPGSIPTNTVNLRVQSTLRKRQYLPYNTLLATSLSSEEVLNTPTSLINQLRTKLSESKDGGVYSLGGLGGIPFAGVAGMKDMLSHSPKDGKIVIIFGPQVGIGKDGKLGVVERIGTEEYGADEANGVVVRAFKNILSGLEPSTGTGFNLEEDYIIGLLKKMPLKEYQSKGDDYAIAKITQNLYEVISELIQKEVETSIGKTNNFWGRVTEVTMMGGVFINRGHGSGTEGGDDYFQPLMMRTLVSGGEVNLYKEVFGDLGTPIN